MKHGIAAALAAVLAAVLALSAPAEGWDGFRGLPWGAFEEDIVEREERVADHAMELEGGCLDLLYEGVEVSRFTGAECAYILYDGALVCGGYRIPVSGETDEADLLEALKVHYGEPNANGRMIFRRMLALLDPEGENDGVLNTSPAAWEVDGTGIILYSEGGHLILLYIGTDYLNAMDAEAGEAGDEEPEDEGSEEEEPDEPETP